MKRYIAIMSHTVHRKNRNWTASVSTTHIQTLTLTGPEMNQKVERRSIKPTVMRTRDIADEIDVRANGQKMKTKTKRNMSERPFT